MIGPPPKVIGHRGAALSAPENTLAGFRRARALAAPWVELDVRLAKGDLPVVIHDDTLDRTTDGTGSVADCPPETLGTLDAGSWFGKRFAGERVPTMAEAAALIAALGLGLNIEVKAAAGREADTARLAVAATRQAWPADRAPPLMSSFSRQALQAAREAAPDWPRALLVDGLPADWHQAALGLGCTVICADHRRLDQRQVARVRAAGLALLAWTVNDPGRARQLFDWGVDGVFSDAPDRILAVA
ncbi:MAG: glycerophosphodiester phosphodiesterase [Alphaproteobacteria bacterium]|nr:glycerophosphodiester phosphodiesterase [Alphaproteobacteria bacterium]